MLNVLYSYLLNPGRSYLTIQKGAMKLIHRPVGGNGDVFIGNTMTGSATIDVEIETSPLSAQ